MSIELRILSGARAGQTETFDAPVVAIGRHPKSDLKFDVKKDLDVSTRHGEIRQLDGRYAIFDLDSTNGTFVNGTRVPKGGSRALKGGDTVQFGPNGPKMTVHIAGEPEPIAATPVSSRRATGLQTPKRSTGERIAIAVRSQTRTLRYAAGAAVILLGGIAAGAVWYGNNQKRLADQKIREFEDRYTANLELLKKSVASADSGVITGLRRRGDSLAAVARQARGSSAAAAAQQALTDNENIQKRIGAMNLEAVRSSNDPAVVLINSELGSQHEEATGFSVNHTGLIVTNAHVVRDSAGVKATRVHVKFANATAWRAAHVVKVADDPKIDLALIQLDERFNTPMVALANSVDAEVGAPITTLGFPEGTALPMASAGNDFIAKTTLTLGTVSKIVLPDLLQIDSWATHGSSGSPVFDAHNHVIGVIWGGRNNRIVFAVPAERINELVKGAR